MNEKNVSEVEGKELAYSEEELAGLLAQNQKLQEKENEGEGIKADYLILAKTGTKALQRSQTSTFRVFRLATSSYRRIKRFWELRLR